MPPVVFPNISERDAATNLRDRYQSRGARIALFQSDTAIDGDTVFADLTECDFDGYTRSAVLAGGTVSGTPDALGRAILTWPVVAYTHDGGAADNTVYGYMAVTDTDELCWCQRFNAPVVMEADVDPLAFIPRLTVSTGPTSGAVVLGIVGWTVPGDSASAVTDVIDMGDWDSVLFVLSVGVVDATDYTVDLLTDNDAGFPSPTVLAGKSTAVHTTPTGENSLCAILLAASDMPTGESFVRASLTIGGSDGSFQFSMIAIGFHSAIAYDSVLDLAAVIEVVS